MIFTRKTSSTGQHHRWAGEGGCGSDHACCVGATPGARQTYRGGRGAGVTDREIVVSVLRCEDVVSRGTGAGVLVPVNARGEIVDFFEFLHRVVVVLVVMQRQASSPCSQGSSSGHP